MDPPAVGTFGAGKRGHIGNAREDGTSLSGENLPSQLDGACDISTINFQVEVDRNLPVHSTQET
jgi:hypothetical protein